MDKKTKMYVGVGAAAVLAYLLLRKSKPTNTASYSGTTMTDIVGNVQRADGKCNPLVDKNCRDGVRTIYAPKRPKIFSANGEYEQIPIPIDVIPKSEYVYCDPLIDKNCRKIPDLPSTVPAYEEIPFFPEAIKKPASPIKIKPKPRPKPKKSQPKVKKYFPEKSFFNVKSSKFGW